MRNNTHSKKLIDWGIGACSATLGAAMLTTGHAKPLCGLATSLTGAFHVPLDVHASMLIVIGVVLCFSVYAMYNACIVTCMWAYINFYTLSAIELGITHNFTTAMLCVCIVVLLIWRFIVAIHGGHNDRRTATRSGGYNRGVHSSRHTGRSIRT